MRGILNPRSVSVFSSFNGNNTINNASIVLKEERSQMEEQVFKLVTVTVNKGFSFGETYRKHDRYRSHVETVIINLIFLLNCKMILICE